MPVVERPLGNGGTVRQWDGGVWANLDVKIKLMTDVAVDGDVVYAVREIEFQTTATGEVPTGYKISAPSDGGWQYWVKIGSNAPFLCNVDAGDGSALSLADLVALAGIASVEASAPQMSWLLAQYTAAQSAVDGNTVVWQGGMLTDGGILAGVRSKLASTNSDIEAGYLHEVNTQAGGVTLALPLLADAVRGVFGFKNHGIDEVVITGSGGETIDGRSQYKLDTHRQTVWLVPSDSGWLVSHEYEAGKRPFTVGETIIGDGSYIS